MRHAGGATVPPYDSGDRDRPPGPPVKLRSFGLHDVQGLYGGNALWAAADRTTIVQVVGDPPAGRRGLWERRYRTTLSAGQWAEVERLVGACHLAAFNVPERPGIPDEACPIIFAVPCDRATIKVRKWANDRHWGFDPVYAHLLGLCRAEGEPIHEGAYDWDWRPDGFDRPW
jgi:hypothetical protein